MVTHQLRDAFYVAEHTAVREDGEVRLDPADPAKVAETEFIMLRDGDIAFEGDVHELRASSRPVSQELPVVALAVESLPCPAHARSPGPS